MSVSAETNVTKAHQEDDREVYSQWYGLGVTILGDGVAPAVPGANIKALEAMQSKFKEMQLRAASYHPNKPQDDNKGVKTLGSAMSNKPLLKKVQEKFKDYRILNMSENGDHELEEQKIEDLEKQIEALERESQARQDFFNDQLDMWEDEKEAWEEHYNDLIEKNNEEIKLLEDRYDFLKSQYDEEIEFWTTKVKELQSSYDAWAERWGDIQDSLTEDVRSLEEILADIAMYGAPELQAQIGNITDLLKDMGVSLGDFNSSIGDSGSGGNTGGYHDIIDQMRENGQKWWEAKNRGDTAEAEYYFKLNQQLGAQIPGITFNPGSGEWYWPDGTPLYDNGGLAVGKGIMVKDVEEPELVLSPEQTKKFFTMPVLAQDVLNQSTNDYDRYMQDMGVMYGTNRDLAPDTRMEARTTNNVDNRDYSRSTYINGVELGDNMLDRPLSEILSLLGIHRDY